LSGLAGIAGIWLTAALDLVEFAAADAPSLEIHANAKAV
jgi:hypothetical protein